MLARCIARTIPGNISRSSTCCSATERLGDEEHHETLTPDRKQAGLSQQAVEIASRTKRCSTRSPPIRSSPAKC